MLAPRWCLACAASLALALPLALPLATAAAQPADGPGDAEVALARDLFRQGVRHVRANEWEEARQAFERAYAIVPRPSVLLNLAAAQVQTGHLVAGAESYRRFLREVTSGPDARRRDAARRSLEQVETRIPRARIQARALREGDRLLLDGDEVSRAVAGEELPVDPGEHVLTVERDGEVVGRAPFSAAEAEQVEVTIQAAPLRRRVEHVPSPTRRRRHDRDEGGGVLASPIFWTLVGVAVVGGVVTAVVLGSGEDDPYRGNVPPGLITLP